jgi:hypothetical protein
MNPRPAHRAVNPRFLAGGKNGSESRVESREPANLVIGPFPRLPNPRSSLLAPSQRGQK